MDPAHIVFLIAVAITIAAIAGYLILIASILKHVVNRLVTILDAVQAVTDTAEPVGPVIDDINRDLAAGRRVIEDAVARLEESREPADTADQAPPRHAPEPGSGQGGARTATAPAPPAPKGGTPQVELPDSPPPERGRGFWNR